MLQGVHGQLSDGPLPHPVAVVEKHQVEFTGDGHDATTAGQRHVGGVVPVVHPAQHDPAAARGVRERHHGIAVAAVVEPVVRPQQRVVETEVTIGRRGDHPVWGERVAVEITDEVLAAAATGHPARVDVHQQHPAGLVMSGHRQFEQVGALPDARGRMRRAERRAVRPVDQVGRAVDHHLLVFGLDGHHHPGVAVPKHLGVAKVGRASVEHRVAGVVGPVRSAVEAVGEALGLGAVPLAARAVVGGVDRHQRRPVGGAQVAGVGGVEHTTAREDLFAVGMPQRDMMLGPGQQVGRRRVPPRHVAPAVVRGVRLVEQVPRAGVVDQPVGVVHPRLQRRVVPAWT